MCCRRQDLIGVYETIQSKVAAQNQSIEMQEVWIFRISNGKIAERWYAHDQSASIG
ncbi:ester cyclase [Methyloprofundus sedimenti]|uniref:ester cyclase n=1 Tax=Methyloprofundus sedimenti TaxID=1420851 RepID=UPI0011811533|nr:ester cyclase [Methyloprofundus sedimenti]